MAERVPRTDTDVVSTPSTEVERPIIYALDLDEDLLAHLPDPDAWVVIHGEGLDPALIEDDFVREVFVWQRQHLREHSRPATGAVLEDQFEDLELAEPETVIGDLIERLRERYARNEQRQVMRELVVLQNEDPVAVVPTLMRRGRELSVLLTKRGDMYGTGDFDRAMRHYDVKVQAGPGASYGHPDLDEYFYGMPAGLYFTIAPPKTYKSWQIIQGAMANAMDGRFSWIDSLELPAEETYMRLQHMLAGVPWWHYLRNCISNDERKRMREASQIIDESGLYKIVKPPSGERSIDAMVHQARDAGADVIYIDQLQYVESSDGLSLGSHNKTGEYWNVLNRARDLSDSGPISIAHQFNRTAMFCDAMPSMEQIKGSSAIEETATLALGLWASKDMRKSSMLEVGVLCSRNYQYAAWEMAVDLSQGCSFQIIGRVPEDE